MSKFTNRKGKIRIYDGTGTPFYLELDFENGNFSGPIGRSKTEEILIMARDVFTSDAHNIEGGDSKIYEPFQITFTAFLESTAQTGYLLDWLEGNTVNSNTIVTTKGDTQNDGANNNPAFADTDKKTCNVEYRLDAATDIVWHYNEVYFDLQEQSISESEEGVDLSLTGMVYGTVVRDTAFTTGTSVEA